MKKIIMFLMFIILFAAVANAQSNSTGLSQISSKQQWTVLSNIDKKVHKIMLIDVTDDGDACGFNVDGYTTWINVKDDKTINGVYIKVFEAYPVHSQLEDTDYCKVFIAGSMINPEAVAATHNATPAENQTAQAVVVSPIEANATNESPAHVIVQTKEEHLNIWQQIWKFFASLFK